MKYVKRITAFFLAVIVAVGAVGYRSQKAYANAIALTGEGLEVLFGLLGATGVVVGIDKTMEQRFVDAQELFDSLPVEQQQSYVDWLAAGQFVVSDTGHEVFYPDMTLDTSWYSDLWQSVTVVFDSANSYDFVDNVGSYDGYLRYLPTSVADNLELNLGGYSDNAYAFHGGGIDSGRIFYFLDDATFVQHFFNDYTGDSTFTLYDCPSDAVLRVRTEYLSTGMRLYITVSNAVGQFFDYHYSITYANSNPNREQGAVWGSDAVADYVYAYPQLYRLNFNPLEAYNYDALIPCDTWVSKWDDAKAENRQVGIITGQDLSGYNTLEDIYNPETGLVTGLNVSDVPVVVDPDVPVTGDLTGIAGGVQSILDWLNSFIDKFIKALGDLLTALFVPSGTAFNEFFDPIMLGLKDKMDLDTFENFKNRMQSLSSPPAPNVTMDRDGVTYIVIDFSSFNDVRDKLWGWLRGYLFVFILLYNMNFIYKLIRGQSMFDGMGTTLLFGWTDPGARGSGGSGGSGGRDRGGRGH